jgi:hypothetical protein
MLLESASRYLEDILTKKKRKHAAWRGKGIGKSSRWASAVLVVGGDEACARPCPPCRCCCVQWPPSLGARWIQPPPPSSCPTAAIPRHTPCLPPPAPASSRLRRSSAASVEKGKKIDELREEEWRRDWREEEVADWGRGPSAGSSPARRLRRPRRRRCPRRAASSSRSNLPHGRRGSNRLTPARRRGPVPPAHAPPPAPLACAPPAAAPRSLANGLVAARVWEERQEGDWERERYGRGLGERDTGGDWGRRLRQVGTGPGTVIDRRNELPPR